MHLLTSSSSVNVWNSLDTDRHVRPRSRRRFPRGRRERHVSATSANVPPPVVSLSPHPQPVASASEKPSAASRSSAPPSVGIPQCSSRTRTRCCRGDGIKQMIDRCAPWESAATRLRGGSSRYGCLCCVCPIQAGQIRDGGPDLGRVGILYSYDACTSARPVRSCLDISIPTNRGDATLLPFASQSVSTCLYMSYSYPCSMPSSLSV